MEFTEKSRFGRHVLLFLAALIVVSLFSLVGGGANQAYADPKTIDLSGSNPTAALQAELNDPTVDVITLTGLAAGGKFQLTEVLTIPHSRDITITAASKVILENPNPTSSGSRPHIRINAASSTEASATLTFINVELHGIDSPPGSAFGGGIEFINADSSKTLTLKGAVVKGCINSRVGGGIYSTGNLIIENSTITLNHGSRGGGVYLWDDAQAGLVTLEIIDSTISNNRATGDYLTIDSWGYYDGGGGVYSEGPLTIKGSTITQNVSMAQGGGVLAHVDATIEDSTISQNITFPQLPTDPDRYGSAIFSSNSGNLITIDSASVVSNRAGTDSHSSKGFSPKVLGIAYSLPNRTNKDVTVTLTTSEPIGTPTGWTPISTTHFEKIYSVNTTTTETVYFDSIATTNPGSADLDITWIDKDAPRLEKLTVNGKELNLTSGANNFVNTSTGVNIVAEVKDDVDSAASAHIKITAEDGDHTFDGLSLDLTDPSIFTPGKSYTIEVTTYDNVIKDRLGSGELNTATYNITFTAQGIVTVKPADRTAVYSGAPLVPNAYEVVDAKTTAGFTAAGLELTGPASYKGSLTDVGSISTTEVDGLLLLSTGATPANAYRIEYAPGTLTVTPRTVGIAIGDRTETFTGSSFTGGLTATVRGLPFPDSGLVAGDSIGNPTIPIDPADILAGRYTYGDGESGIGATHNNYGAGFFRIVNASGDVTSNYSIIVTDGTFTVVEPAVVPPPPPAPVPPAPVPPAPVPPAPVPPAPAPPPAPVPPAPAPPPAPVPPAPAPATTGPGAIVPAAAPPAVVTTTPATPAPAPATPATPAPAPATGDATTPPATTPQTLAEDETPLAAGATSAWSLLNLILTGFVLVMTVALLIAFFTGEDERRKQRGIGLIGIVFAIGAIVLFVLTQDLTQPMLVVDEYTLWFAAIAVAQAVIAILALRKGTEPAAQEQ